MRRPSRAGNKGGVMTPQEITAAEETDATAETNRLLGVLSERTMTTNRVIKAQGSQIAAIHATVEDIKGGNMPICKEHTVAIAKLKAGGAVPATDKARSWAILTGMAKHAPWAFTVLILGGFGMFIYAKANGLF